MILTTLQQTLVGIVSNLTPSHGLAPSFKSIWQRNVFTICHKCHGARRVRTCEEQSAELLTVTPHHTQPNTQFNSRNTKIPQWRWEIVFVKTVSRQQTGCAPFETYPVINNCASVKICCCPFPPRRKGAECEADLQLLTAAAQF